MSHLKFVIQFLLFGVLFSRGQFQHDNMHHGFYPDAVIENGVTLHWHTQTGGAIRSTPAVTTNKVIVGSSDGNVYCFNKMNGSILWKFNAGSSVSSSPIVNDGNVYVVSRDNILFALQISNGKLLWKKNLGTALPYEWGFDYYYGSVTIENAILYVGSGDGSLYALNAKDGKERWRFKTTSPIRSTPALDKNTIYFGNSTGKIFALDKLNGSLRWTFSTIGDTLTNEQFGFDRKAVISSPTVVNNKLFIGGRDGFLYALESSTGKELWQYDYKVSWIISTAAVKDTILVTGTSDGRFIHALNTADGKEIWRFTTNGPVWASPAIVQNNVVVIPGNDGYVYALNLVTGNEIWRYKIGPQIFSSAVPDGNALYFGSDNGFLYSLTTHHIEQEPIQALKRAVFWTKDPIVQSFRNGMDVYVRDYFIREGYEFYDETDFKDFLLSRIHSDTASVVVFATNYFIPSIIKDTLGSNIFREYLRSGGKVIILGINPSVYQIDYDKKQFLGLDYSLSGKITSIKYQYKDLRSHGGYYWSTVTAKGKDWGLKNNFVGVGGMPLNDVDIPLAIDENGKATAWVKKFNQRKGSGFVQLFITPDRLSELPQIQKVAEYGLR